MNSSLLHALLALENCSIVTQQSNENEVEVRNPGYLTAL